MDNLRKPHFNIGEVAILQPPHPSACHLRGEETTILDIMWSDGAEDAMGQNGAHWSYYTDIAAPPPTDLPEDQHDNWVWCEYDLRKKYEPGEDFESILESMKVTI